MEVSAQYPSYKKDFTRGPLTRGPRASSCYWVIIEHLRMEYVYTGMPGLRSLHTALSAVIIIAGE